MWNLRSKTVLTTVRRGAGSLAFLADGKTLLAANGKFASSWNTVDWTEQKPFANLAGPLALSQGGSKLALLSGNRFGPGSQEGLRIFDTTNWEQKRVLQGISAPIALSADGASIAGSTRAGITLWQVNDSQGELVLEGSTNIFANRGFSRNDKGLVFSPDGKYVVASRNTLSEHGVFILNVWDASSGKEKGTIPEDPEHIEHIGVISTVVFSPDGHTLATASMDHSIRLWDFTTRQRVATLQGHLSEVLALAFSPDGQSLVSAAKDGEIKIWPTHPKTKEDAFPGVKQPLAFSRDGQILAARSRDDNIVFLNLSTGEIEEQFQLEKARGRFFSIDEQFQLEKRRFFGAPPGPVFAISEDLKTLVQGLDDGSVKI